MSGNAAHADTVGSLRPVGVIRSVLTTRHDAPKQGSEGAPDAWLEVLPWFAEGLHRMSAGDQIIVITWLHQAHRDVLQVHPRSNPNNPLRSRVSAASVVVQQSWASPSSTHCLQW